MLTLTAKPFALHRVDRNVEHALLCDRPVVDLFQTIEMDREKEIRRRLEQIELLLEQEGVRAERHELPLLHEPSHDRADLAMNQGLSTGNRDNRRSAFIDGV